MGKTILISSHILPELADLCNTVGIIEQGELLYSGPVADIVKRAQGRERSCTSASLRAPEQAAALLAAASGCRIASRRTTDSSQVSLKNGVQDYSFIPSQLMAGGVSGQSASRRKR